LTTALRFLWIASRGYRLTPWRSPYLKWRIETYSGLPASKVTFTDFWKFTWRERAKLGRFLQWTSEMDAYRHNPRGDARV